MLGFAGPCRTLGAVVLKAWRLRHPSTDYAAMHESARGTDRRSPLLRCPSGRVATSHVSLVARCWPGSPLRWPLLKLWLSPCLQRTARIQIVVGHRMLRGIQDLPTRDLAPT